MLWQKAIYSHLYWRIFFPHSPLSSSDFKLVCNVYIVYGNLNSENSQDCAQKLNKIVNSALGLKSYSVSVVFKSLQLLLKKCGVRLWSKMC